MPARDLPSDCLPFGLLAPFAYSAPTATAALDLSPWDGGAVLLLSLFTISGNLTVALRTRTDSGDSWTTIGSATVLASGFAAGVRPIFVRREDCEAEVSLLLTPGTSFTGGVDGVAFGRANGVVPATTWTIDSRTL